MDRTKISYDPVSNIYHIILCRYTVILINKKLVKMFTGKQRDSSVFIQSRIHRYTALWSDSCAFKTLSESDRILHVLAEGKG